MTSFLNEILGDSLLYICTDRNPQAIQCIAETAQVNHNHSTEVVQSDLLSNLQPRLNGMVDLLVFNPPYVVTPPAEIDSSDIASSWAGGTRGRMVMDRLFPHIPSLLSKRGIFYLVVIKENDPEEICSMFESLGFKSESILSRQAGPEHLSILKFTRLQCATSGEYDRGIVCQPIGKDSS